MCRIAGIVNKNFSKEEFNLRISAMNSSQEHGGPDGNGLFIDSDLGLAIGHRRLSLLDLSDAGAQPMFCSSREYCISFNGEIYNYLEIKAKLQSIGYLFRTNTDTEVVLNAFKEWGVKAFKMFNGMFAFSILDLKNRELFLVRDLIGMKPLYYFHQKDRLVFASEIKAFQKSGLQFQENSDWRPLFLSFGYIPEPFSTLKDVLQLKPGSYIKYDLNTGNIQEHEFERLEYTDDITDLNEATFLLKQTLTEAVERHLIADTPVGVFLSGGLDSSILTLLASQSQKTKLKTLSINFDENAYNERNYQHLITSTIHSEHADFKISTTDYLNALPEIKNAFDQPTNDAINTWFISKYAKQEGLKACISGLGGDELFGGYPSFNRVNQLRALKNIPSKLFNVANHFPEGRLKKFAFLHNDNSINDYLFFRGFYTPKSISQLVNISEQEVNSILSKVPIKQIPEHIHPKNYVSHLEQNLYMRSQLLKDTDIMGMAHGVEIRMPFLDKEVLKLVYRIRPDIKFKLKNKGILAKSFEDILPKKVISREKKGFTLPLQEWQKSNSELNTLKKHPNAKVRRIAINTLSGKSHWAKLWILTFLPDYLVKKSVLFLSLKTFSLMGGIERMNRVIMKAGHDIQGEGNIRFNSYCLHDSNADIDERYLPKSDFHAFEGNIIRFFFEILINFKRYDIILLSHINLAAAGALMKVFFNKKIFIIAHGIEIWRELGRLKSWALTHSDKILCVSNYTLTKVKEVHHVSPEKLYVLNNCLDPFFKANTKVREKINSKKVLFTLCRISDSELYKGYDKVIDAIAILKKKNYNIEYILGGKYDQKEALRITSKIKEHQLESSIKLVGFIKENQLNTYFSNADLFILPSKKEGFGIVFIEALAHGLPVIAGNQDGSVDALKNGELGMLINPDDITNIANAIEVMLNNTEIKSEDIANKTQYYFGFANYKNQLQTHLLN